MNNIPLIQIIEAGKAEFVRVYGFNAQRLHVTARLEQVIQRWAAKNLPPRSPQDFGGAELCGLELLQSTKAHTTKMEFWLSTERGGQVYSVHRELNPEDFGIKNRVVQGETLIETSEASYDED